MKEDFKVEQPKELTEYIKKFGKEPNLIGMVRSPDALMAALADAVKKGVPYDQYQLLSKENQKAYDDFIRRELALFAHAVHQK